ARGPSGLLAAVPDRLSGAWLYPDLERPDRADKTGLEPAGQAGAEFSAQPQLRTVRGYRRDGQLVRSPLHQHADQEDGRADRLPGRLAAVPCPADPAHALRRAHA